MAEVRFGWWGFVWVFFFNWSSAGEGRKEKERTGFCLLPGRHWSSSHLYFCGLPWL